MLSVAMLSVTMLSVVTLSVVKLSVIMLDVVGPKSSLHWYWEKIEYKVTYVSFFIALAPCMNTLSVF